MTVSDGPVSAPTDDGPVEILCSPALLLQVREQQLTAEVQQLRESLDAERRQNAALTAAYLEHRARDSGGSLPERPAAVQT